MTSTNPQSRESNIASGSPQAGEPVYLAVGKTCRPHGVHGEILMEILSDFPERIKAGSHLFIGEKKQELIITQVRPAGQKILISIEGITDRDQAGLLRNLLVYIPLTDVAPLPKDHFYHHEIVGMLVEDDSGNHIGTVIEVLVTGANDVYVVRTPDNTELLLPAIKSVIILIERETRKMVVKLQEWE